MIRAVLAVALAVALCAATFPAIDRARVDHAGALADREVARIDSAALALADGESAVAPGRRGAQRSLRVCLPTRSWSTAGVRSFALRDGGGADGRGDGPAREDATVAYRVGDGPPVVRRFDAPLRIAGDGIVLHPGCHRLVLTAIRVDGDDGVAVAVRVGRRRSHPRGERSSRKARQARPCDT